MEISGFSSSKYEGQLEILLKQELKIEDLQQKLVNNGGSYAAMIKNEEQVRAKFVDLLQTKYPELASLSDSEVISLIEQVPDILQNVIDLDHQISLQLSTIPVIVGALSSATQERTEAQAKLAADQEEQAGILDKIRQASAENLKTTNLLIDAQKNYFTAVQNYGEDSEQALAALSVVEAAQTADTAAHDALQTLRARRDALPGEIADLTEQISHLDFVIVTLQVLVNQGGFTSISALEDTLNGAIQERTDAISTLAADQEEQAGILDKIREASAENLKTTNLLIEAQKKYFTAVQNYGEDSEQALAALSVVEAAQTTDTAAHDKLQGLRARRDALPGEIAGLTQRIAELDVIIPVLQAQFDSVDALQKQVDDLAASNAVYSLYQGFSATEKELVTLFTN